MPLIRNYLSKEQQQKFDEAVAQGVRFMETASELADDLNEHASQIAAAAHPYYVCKEQGVHWVISNVPMAFYESSVSTYRTPSYGSFI